MTFREHAQLMLGVLWVESQCSGACREHTIDFAMFHVFCGLFSNSEDIQRIVRNSMVSEVTFCAVCYLCQKSRLIAVLWCASM